MLVINLCFTYNSPFILFHTFCPVLSLFPSLPQYTYPYLGLPKYFLF